MPSSDGSTGRVWYAAYGSNLDPARFDCYLLGGCPPGATRDYPGTRDAAGAEDTRASRLPGQVVFGWESPTWGGGGIAFHVPDAEGEVPATCYLLTHRQFSDVLEQEMWRSPGADHDLAEVLATGRAAIGPGRYETLRLAGELDGHPVLTFTAPEPPAPNPPAGAYLATMAGGLRAVHGLSDDEIADHLLACRGARPRWDRDSVLAAIAPVA
ncbi:MAG TPA: histone deacetylase [Nocardioides sp.]|nr:histone deacetylase [Nocardioides sp.]